MSLPNPGMTFTPFDPLTAAEMNDLVENIEALAAGTGLDTNAVGASKLATSAIFLGYSQITGSLTTGSASFVDAAGLAVGVTVPAGGRDVKITAYMPSIGNSGGAGAYEVLTVNEGAAVLGQKRVISPQNGRTDGTIIARVSAPSAGSHTYKVQWLVSSGTGTMEASALGSTTLGGPNFILVELM